MGLWDNFKEEYETPKDKEGWTELECIYAGEGVSKNGNEMLKVQVKTPMGIKLFHYVVFGTENTNRNFTITLHSALSRRISKISSDKRRSPILKKTRKAICGSGISGITI